MRTKSILFFALYLFLATSSISAQTKKTVSSLDNFWGIKFGKICENTYEIMTSKGWEPCGGGILPYKNNYELSISVSCTSYNKYNGTYGNLPVEEIDLLSYDGIFYQVAIRINLSETEIGTEDCEKTVAAIIDKYDLKRNKFPDGKTYFQSNVGTIAMFSIIQGDEEVLGYSPWSAGGRGAEYFIITFADSKVLEKLDKDTEKEKEEKQRQEQKSIQDDL